MQIHPKVFDAHCDTIFRCWDTGEPLFQNQGAWDVVRVRQSFCGCAQVFALWCARGHTKGLALESVYQQMLCLFQRQMEAYRPYITLCKGGREVEQAIAEGRIAALLSVEGAELLDCDPNRLQQAAADGVRIITLTWNHANALSGSSREQSHRGLSGQGLAFLQRMGELGILADVSHLSEAGFWDVMAHSRLPVLATHSNVKSVWNHARNLTDRQITAIIEHQGIVGLNFYREFVGLEQNQESVRRHLDRILALGGAKHVALGGDWDGCDLISDTPDITGLTRFYEYLLKSRYDEQVIRDFFFCNLMRVVSNIELCEYKR